MHVCNLKDYERKHYMMEVPLTVKANKKVRDNTKKPNAERLADIAFDNAIKAIDGLNATALDEKALSDELMKLDRFIDAANSWRQEVSWVLAVRQYFAKRAKV